VNSASTANSLSSANSSSSANFSTSREILRLGEALFRSRSWTPIPLALWIIIHARPRRRWIVRGMLLAIVGLALRLWAVAHIGPNSRTRGEGPSRQATGGPYAFLAHPLYLANAILSEGLVIASGAGWPLLQTLFPWIWFAQYGPIMLWEEETLRRRFGTIRTRASESGYENGGSGGLDGHQRIMCAPTQPQPSSDGFATRSPRIYPEGGEIVREEALRLKPGAMEERSSLKRAASRGDRSLETEKRHPPRYFVDDHETLPYPSFPPVRVGLRLARNRPGKTSRTHSERGHGRKELALWQVAWESERRTRQSVLLFLGALALSALWRSVAGRKKSAP